MFVYDLSGCKFKSLYSHHSRIFCINHEDIGNHVLTPLLMSLNVCICLLGQWLKISNLKKSNRNHLLELFHFCWNHSIPHSTYGIWLPSISFLVETARSTVISHNSLVWKFCGKKQFLIVWLLLLFWFCNEKFCIYF